MSRNSYKDKYQGLSSKNYFEEPKLDLDEENGITAEEEAAAEETPIIETAPKKEERKNEGVPGKVKTLSNVREAPSMTSNVLYIAQAGTPITIYDHPGDFYRITNNDHLEGYIKKDLCEKS